MMRVSLYRGGLDLPPEARDAMPRWSRRDQPGLQRVPMPCDRAPKSSLAGATVVDTSGGRAEAPYRLGAVGPTGVQEQGVGTRGSLGNLRTPRSQGDAVSNNRWRETWRVPRNPWTYPRNNDGQRNSLSKARRWDSRLWLTSSTSTGSARRTGVRARTGRWAWTNRAARTMRRIWRTTSDPCWTEPSPALTGRLRCRGPISPRRARRPKLGCCLSFDNCPAAMVGATLVVQAFRLRGGPAGGTPAPQGRISGRVWDV